MAPPLQHGKTPPRVLKPGAQARRNDQQIRQPRSVRGHTVAGKHVVVELKRASVQMGVYQLAEQGAKYVHALKETLPPEEKNRATIEVVFAVGRSPYEQSERIENAMNSVALGSRIVTYDLLIDRARQAYATYIGRTGTAERIKRMLRDLDAVV